MKKARIVVVGSAIVDYTFFTERFPRAGETVVGTEFRTGPGGKGSNQATAAHRAGGEVFLVSRVGKDLGAKVLLDHYDCEKMSTEFIFESAAHSTGAAAIDVDAVHGENRIIVVKGANAALSIDDVRAAETMIARADILLLQLEIGLEAVAEAIRLAKKHGVVTVMNPAPAQAVPDGFFAGVDFFTPNETEAEFYSGLPVNGREEAAAAAQKLFSLGVKNVVMTLGKAGAAHFGADGSSSFCAPPRVEVVDTTGAGDAFNGGFCVALGEGLSIGQALVFANATAAISVSRKGTSPAMPHRAEIDALIGKNR